MLLPIFERSFYNTMVLNELQLQLLDPNPLHSILDGVDPARQTFAFCTVFLPDHFQVPYKSCLFVPFRR